MVDFGVKQMSGELDIRDRELSEEICLFTLMDRSMSGFDTLTVKATKTKYLSNLIRTVKDRELLYRMLTTSNWLDTSQGQCELYVCEYVLVRKHGDHRYRKDFLLCILLMNGYNTGDRRYIKQLAHREVGVVYVYENGLKTVRL